MAVEKGKLSIRSLFACSVLISSAALFGAEVLAHTTDKYSGTWPTPSNMRVQVFSSAYPYWTPIQSVFNWDGIAPASKLYIRRIEYDSSDPNLGDEINVYGQDLGDPVNGWVTWADALNYKKVLWWYSPCWDSCTWAKSVVRLNTNPVAYPDLSDLMKKAVITHEVGHSLGLRHPSHDVNAIMRQGTVTYYVPQDHDKDVVRSKYGQ